MPDMEQFELDGVVYDVRDPTKAPAGYGLGENAAACPNSDCNQAVNSGWYTVSGSNTVNGPGENGVMLVLRRNSSCIWQYHFSYSANPSVRRRMCISDAWYEWEWVNPPMAVGVEYRTTERWQGKPVYTQLFDCGSLPNNTTKTTVLQVTKNAVIDVQAVAIGSSGTYKLPALNETDSGNKVAFWNMGTSMVVKTFGSGWDGFNLYVTLKYTKN